MSRADLGADLGTVIRYSGSDFGNAARARILAAFRELEQLRAARSPLFVTADEMREAWFDTHNRVGQEPTREALNAILANRIGAK